MSVFTLGVEIGVSKLGEQVGSKLPSILKTIPLHDQKITIDNLETDMIYKALDQEGNKIPFFFSRTENKYTPIIFDLEKYDSVNKQYIYTRKKTFIRNRE